MVDVFLTPRALGPELTMLERLRTDPLALYRGHSLNQALQKYNAPLVLVKDPNYQVSFPVLYLPQGAGRDRGDLGEKSARQRVADHAEVRHFDRCTA